MIYKKVDVKFIKLNIILMLVVYVISHVLYAHKFSVTTMVMSSGAFFVSCIYLNLGWIEKYHPSSNRQLAMGILIAPLYTLSLLGL